MADGYFSNCLGTVPYRNLRKNMCDSAWEKDPHCAYNDFSV